MGREEEERVFGRGEERGVEERGWKGEEGGVGVGRGRGSSRGEGRGGDPRRHK